MCGNQIAFVGSHYLPDSCFHKWTHLLYFISFTSEVKRLADAHFLVKLSSQWHGWEYPSKELVLDFRGTVWISVHVPCIELIQLTNKGIYISGFLFILLRIKQQKDHCCRTVETIKHISIVSIQMPLAVWDKKIIWMFWWDGHIKRHKEMQFRMHTNTFHLPRFCLMMLTVMR